eukprot:gene29137-32671_t
MERSPKLDFFSSSSSVPATSVQLLQQQQSQQQQYETFNDFGDDDDFFNPKPAPALRREEVKERGRGASTEDPFAAVSSDPFADTPSTARRKLREMYDIHEDEELEQEGTHGIKGEIQPVREGEILSRLSARTLINKDWHDTYYVIDRGILFLYRSRLDYQYNPKGTPNFKKKIPITHNLRLLQIKAKEYKGYGLVYNFMLEEVLDYGPANVGKFA